MSRLREIFFCAILLLCFSANNAKAQAVLEITSSNITTGVPVSATATNTIGMPSGLIGGILGGLLSIVIKGTLTNDFTTPSSILPAISTNVGSVGTSLLSSSTPYTLDQLLHTTQTMYSATISLESAQATIQYQIPQAKMASYAWVAGNYINTSLSYTAGTLLSSKTSTPTLTLIVDPFINFQSTPRPVTLTVDNLNYYRGTPLSGTTTFINQYTVPLNIAVSATKATLDYTPLYSGAAAVSTPVSYITANLSSPSVGSGKNLSTSYQNVSPGGISIPVGNKQSSTITYSISSTNLKAGFLQAGDYITNINYQASDASATPSASPAQVLSVPFTVHVDTLSALELSTQNISLSFNNASDYTNGVDTTIQGHLTLSSTVACSVTVSATSSALTNGSNSIPLDCVSIGVNGSSQSVNLSTTPQTIISGITPVIDQPLNITYSIPKSKVSEMLGKPPGTYTTQLVYTLTAP